MAFVRQASPTRRRSAKRRAPEAETGPSADTILLVLRRATRLGTVCCELCGGELLGDRGLSWSLHHRRYRDHRPDSHSPQNLLALHGASNVDECHGLVHRSKADAMESGWSLSRHGFVNPLLVPVLIDAGSRWVYLTASGEYSDNPPEEAS